MNAQTLGEIAKIQIEPQKQELGVIKIRNFDEKIKKWLLNAYIFIQVAIIFYLFIFIIITFSFKAGFSNDVSVALVSGTIACLGAMIGGLVTYYGVLVTIKHQRMNMILDKYPERIMAGERINAFLGDLQRSIDKCFNYGSMGVYTEDFEELNDSINNIYLKNIEKYKIDAALISRLAFQSMKNIEYCLELYENKFHRDIIYGIEREGIDWDKSDFRAWINHFSDDIDKIKDEILRVDKEFEKYSRINND